MSLIVGSIALLALVVWVLLRPSAAVALYFYAMALQLVLYMLGSPGGFARVLSVALVLVAGTIMAFRPGGLKWRWSRLDGVWVALTGWMLLSFIWSNDAYGEAPAKLLAWIIFATMLYILPRVFVSSLSEMEGLVRGLAIAAGGTVLFALYLHMEGSLGVVGGRATAMGNPLSLARVAWVGLLAAVYLIMRGPSRMRVLGVCIAPVAIWVGFITGSRGPLLSAMVAMFVMWLFMRGAHRVWVGVAVALAAVLFLYGFMSFVPEESVERLMTLKGSSLQTSDRYPLYLAGLRQGLESGGLGGGIGSFATYHGGGRYPHNLFIEAWGELGLPGLVMISMLLAGGAIRLLTIYRAAKHDRNQALVVAFIAGVATFGFVQSMTTADLPLQTGIWLTLGLLTCPRESFASEYVDPMLDEAATDGYDYAQA